MDDKMRFSWLESVPRITTGTIETNKTTNGVYINESKSLDAYSMGLHHGFGICSRICKLRVRFQAMYKTNVQQRSFLGPLNLMFFSTPVFFHVTIRNEQRNCAAILAVVFVTL